MSIMELLNHLCIGNCSYENILKSKLHMFKIKNHFEKLKTITIISPFFSEKLILSFENKTNS